MKKRLIPLLSAVFLACGQSPKNQSIGEQTMTDGVEVLSFHTKKRCPTCVAIEQLTREVIETEFAAQLADGSLALRVTDITETKLWQTNMKSLGRRFSSIIVREEKSE